MERYFEFQEGTSHKFWAVRREGTSVTTRYGKVGSAGQTTVKTEATEAKAQALMDKLIREKTGKGYQEKASGAPGPAGADPIPAAAPADLEKARKALKADEPYSAWKLATAGLKSTEDATPEQLEVIVAALDSICSDLDEHGSANMDLYGGGKISSKKFFALRDEARNLERKRRNPGSGAAPGALATGPASVVLGAPVKLHAGPGPVPLITVNGFLSQDDEDEPHVVVRSLEDGAVKVVFDLTGHRRVVVSPDGALVAIGRWDSHVHLFEAKTGAKLWEAKEVGNDWVTALDFSADGKRLAVGTHDVAVLDVKSGKRLAFRELGDGSIFGGKPIHAIAFAAGGAQVAAAQEGRLKVFDSASLEPIRIEEVKLYSSATLVMVDGRRALVALPGALGMLDVETTEVLGKAKVKSGVNRAAVNAERTLAAVLSGGDKTAYVEVYSLNPMKQLASLKLPSPNDTMLANAGVVFVDGALLVTALSVFKVPVQA
ncbi:MAG: WGR domain-containing protein [Myxococcales bacterium]